MSLKRLWQWFGTITGMLSATTLAGLLLFDKAVQQQVGLMFTYIYGIAAKTMGVSVKGARNAIQALQSGSRRVDEKLRWWLRIIGLSPFIVFSLAFLPYRYAIVAIPSFLFVPMLALVFLATQRITLTIVTVGVAMAVPIGRRMIFNMLGILVIATVAGLLFAVVPVSTDRALMPLFFISLVILFVPTGEIKAARLAKIPVGIGLVILIVIFILGGRTKAWTTVSGFWPDSGQPKSGAADSRPAALIAPTPASVVPGKGIPTAASSFAATARDPHAPCSDVRVLDHTGDSTEQPISILDYGPLDDCYKVIVELPKEWEPGWCSKPAIPPGTANADWKARLLFVRPGVGGQFAPVTETEVFDGNASPQFGKQPMFIALKGTRERGGISFYPHYVVACKTT